jgi:hypothetical protein
LLCCSFAGSTCVCLSIAALVVGRTECLPIVCGLRNFRRRLLPCLCLPQISCAMKALCTL